MHKHISIVDNALRSLTSERRPLYAAHRELRSGLLDVGDGHQLFWSTSGNPARLPVIFLHGGPGGATSRAITSLFNPKLFHLVRFDQRGCGRSQYEDDLKANTTQHLIEDIERLRGHLGIDEWLVFGGSWGSTLALAYAQAYPQRSMALVLRGQFLGSAPELDWFLTGMRQFFPEAAAAFYAPIEAELKAQGIQLCDGLVTDPSASEAILECYWQHLTSNNSEERARFGQAWAKYEANCATLLPQKSQDKERNSPQAMLALARLEAHYFRNRLFLKPDQLIDGLDRIRTIPGVLVHGRYDAICPVSTAWRLKAAWPELDVRIVPDAGHSANEPGIAAALITATEEMRARLLTTGINRP